MPEAFGPCRRDIMTETQKSSSTDADMETPQPKQVEVLEERLLHGRDALPLTSDECKLIIATPRLLTRVARVLAIVNIEILYWDSQNANIEFKDLIKLLELFLAQSGQVHGRKMERWLDPKRKPVVATKLSEAELEDLSIRVKSNNTSTKERCKIQKQLGIVGEIISERKPMNISYQ